MLIMTKKITCIIVLTGCYLTSMAQQSFDSLLNVSSTQYPQEKIYLHLDKPYYNTGETIWFKGYITANNTPSHISKTMYAELINSDGKILQRKTMPIFQAGAASFFELSDSNYSSKLFIRAYTSWMLNFDSSLLFLRPITVINSKPEISKTRPSESFDLTFFPEGGDLVENINSRIAFKATNQEGMPFTVSGKILNSKGETISSFMSTHDGMGFFSIEPLPHEKYRAVWKDKNGLQHETPLPEAKILGIVLSIENNSGLLTYSITRPELADDVFKSFTVIAHMQQELVYRAKINMQRKTKISAPIMTDSMSDGILVLTVFNAAQVPVAERIAFINNNNYYFNTDLHAVEKNITRHGKTVLQVDIGDTLLTNLSIAVTDAGFDSTVDNKENIYSSLLLSGDCKGYIYNAAYYFSSDADSVREQLDLVMMTNGWRRFKWEEMLAYRWPKLVHRPDDYITLSGSVFGLPKMQYKNREITGILQSAEHTSTSIFSMPINDEGKFSQGGIYFFDTARFYYQLNNDKEKKLTAAASFNFGSGFESAPIVTLNSLSHPFFNSIPDSNILQKNRLLASFYRSQSYLQKFKTLEMVKVSTKQKSLKEKLDKQYSSGMFSGGDARIFTTEDDPFASSARNVLEYLRGKVPGLEINSFGEGSIKRRGVNTEVFLDEMTTDIGMLETVSMNSVAMIKVFDPPFFGAFGGGPGGAVAVYTKKGWSENGMVKGLNSVNLTGYSPIRQFYMPNYGKTNSNDEVDYRTTLYWNPFLLMGRKERRVTIPFFNSDNCKKIRVVIEGINEMGQLTREEKIFE